MAHHMDSSDLRYGIGEAGWAWAGWLNNVQGVVGYLPEAGQTLARWMVSDHGTRGASHTKVMPEVARHWQNRYTDCVAAYVGGLQMVGRAIVACL